MSLTRREPRGDYSDYFVNGERVSQDTWQQVVNLEGEVERLRREMKRSREELTDGLDLSTGAQA